MNHSLQAYWSLGTVLALTACAPAHDNGPSLFVVSTDHLSIYASPYNGSPVYDGSGKEIGMPFGLAFDGKGRLFLGHFPDELVSGEDPHRDQRPSVGILEPPYRKGIGIARNYPQFLGPPMIVDTAGRLFVYMEDHGPVPPSSGSLVGLIKQLSIHPGPAALLEYDPPYLGEPTATIATNARPSALALNADDHLFVASGFPRSTIREYALPYTGAPLTTIHEGIDSPVAMAFDTKGDLFVANNDQYKNNASSVTEYAPPYRSAPIATIRAFTHPISLALDSHDNLFVANNDKYKNDQDAAGGAVVEYAPPYRGAPIATIRHPLTLRDPLTVLENILAMLSAHDDGGPYEVALDTHDNLFIMNATYGQIEEYAPPYTSEAVRIFPAGSFAFAPSTPQPKNVSPGRTDVKVRR